MTRRKDIEKAAKQAGFYAFSDMEVVEFALEMVRRHNDELQKAAFHILQPRDARLYKLMLEAIRGTKP